MRIKKGKVTDDFYVAGSAGMPVYLLDGPAPALFDAGITVLAKIYENDIHKILGNRSPAYLFLTHAHFDHVGTAGYFKRIWPGLKIVASAKSRAILQRPGAIKLISDLNAAATKRARQSGLNPINEIPFEPFDIDLEADHKKQFEISPDITIEAVHTPGHTRDFTTYWISDKKILIASEAVGFQEIDGSIQTEFLIDYDSYMDNIARLSHLDMEVLCPGHYRVLTGADAKSHLHQAPKSAKAYLAMVETFLNETKGDLEAAAIKVKAAEWDPKPWPKQAEDAYMLNTRQRVKVVWERMQD